MNKKIPLSDVFKIVYPRTAILSEQEFDPRGVPWIGSSGSNNGTTARVRRNSDLPLFERGSITVALKGTVLSSFVQPEDFHVAHQIAVLIPLQKMSIQEKLWYCSVIRANRFRFNYGRQADREFRRLVVPPPPNWVDSMEVPDLRSRAERFLKSQVSIKRWGTFRISELGNVEKGERLRAEDMLPGPVAFIAATEAGNGVSSRVTPPLGHKIHPAGCVTVVYNGNSVGEAFLQPEEFLASDDVNVLYLNTTAKLAKLFICQSIRVESFRFNYGRKWNAERMRATHIRLPATSGDTPDYDLMVRFMQSLRFSRLALRHGEN